MQLRTHTHVRVRNRQCVLFLVISVCSMCMCKYEAVDVGGVLSSQFMHTAHVRLQNHLCVSFLVNVAPTVRKPMSTCEYETMRVCLWSHLLLLLFPLCSAFDDISGVVECGAGCILEDLMTFLRERDYAMPLDLGAKGRHVSPRAPSPPPHICALVCGSLFSFVCAHKNVHK